MTECTSLQKKELESGNIVLKQNFYNDENPISRGKWGFLFLIGLQYFFGVLFSTNNSPYTNHLK